MRHPPELRNPEDYKRGWTNCTCTFNAWHTPPLRFIIATNQRNLITSCSYLPLWLSSFLSSSYPSNDFFLLNFTWPGTHIFNADHGGRCFRPSLLSPQAAITHLLVLLHRGVQLLREVVGDIRHAGLLLVAPTQAALVFAGFLIIFLFSIFAVSLRHLQVSRGNKKMLTFLSDLNNTNGKRVSLSFKLEILIFCFYQLLFSQTLFFKLLFTVG